MKLLLQPFKQAAGIFRLPLSPGFVLLHLFHVPTRLFSTVDSYYSSHSFCIHLSFFHLYIIPFFCFFLLPLR